jgi:hypothetical protein
MKLLLISGIAAAALLASAATVLRSHTPPIDRPVASAGMISPQEFQATANLHKIPIENFEDRFEAYSTATKP